MLDRFGMTDSNSVSTPLKETEEVVNAPLIDGNDLQEYLQGVGCLQWIASTLVRPDVAVAARLLGSARARANTWHVAQLKHALRYLKGTPKLGIRLRRNSAHFRLVVRCDSNWAACKVTRRSVSALHATVGNMPLATICKNQNTVAISSQHSETIGMSETCRRLMTWRRLLGDLGFPQQGPTILYCDNKAALALAANQLQIAELSRHLATRHLYVRELQGRGFVLTDYVKSASNAADFTTKVLPPAPFLLLRGVCMGHTTSEDIP